jgi:hypothetical protein
VAHELGAAAAAPGAGGEEAAGARARRLPAAATRQAAAQLAAPAALPAPPHLLPMLSASSLACMRLAISSSAATSLSASLAGSLAASRAEGSRMVMPVVIRLTAMGPLASCGWQGGEAGGWGRLQRAPGQQAARASGARAQGPGQRAAALAQREPAGWACPLRTSACSAVPKAPEAYTTVLLPLRASSALSCSITNLPLSSSASRALE